MATWDLLDEDCSDISDWTDGDVGNGVSSVNPAGQFQFVSGSVGLGNYAYRARDIGSFPNTFTYEIKTYHDVAGTRANADFLNLNCFQADEYFSVIFCSDGLFINDTDSGYTEVGTDLVKQGGSAEWQIWRFLVTFGSVGDGDGVCDVYLKDSTHNWEKVGSAIPCSKEAVFPGGLTSLAQYGQTTANQISHVDYVKIATGFILPFVGSSAGVSGAEGSLSFAETEIVGSTTATLTASGTLELESEIISSVIATTNVAGSLEFETKAISGTVAVTISITGSLELEQSLISSADAISNIIGSLEFESELISAAAAISNITGSLEFESEFISSAAAISNIIGSLGLESEFISYAVAISNITGSSELEQSLNSSTTAISSIIGSLLSTAEVEIISSAVAISNSIGLLELELELNGYVSEIADVIGYLESELNGSIAIITSSVGSLNILTNLISSVTSISNTSGILNVLNQLIGESTNGASTVSETNIDKNIISSITEVAGAICSFDSQPGMGSSIVEISGIAASLSSLNVLTDLTGFIASTSSTSGFLDVLTQLIGNSTNGISFLGRVAKLISLIGSITAVSNLPDTSNYLAIVPDFEAATLFWRPQDSIVETLEWKTSILNAYDGSEQRIKIRQTPRQLFNLRLILNTNKENTWFDSIIHTWQKLTWLLPIWSEYVEHTADINAKDESIENIDTTNADFRNDSKAMVWKSATEYEVVVIDTKTDSNLNLSYSMLNSYTGIKYIMPVRTAYLIASSKKERYNSETSVVNLTFAVYNNVEFTDYVPNTIYDGYEVLDTPAFMDDTHSEDSDGDILITDFETGIFKVESSSNFNFLSQSHKFFNDNKVACWNFRKFLHSLSGRQKTIIIPTFRSDVTQTDDIETTDTSVKIENIKLATNMGFNALRTYIGFYFTTTGVLIIRKIKAIVEIDANEERISFNTNLGLANPVVSGDCKICFVDKCRLTSDSIQINWQYANRNECKTNFMRVHNGGR